MEQKRLISAWYGQFAEIATGFGRERMGSMLPKRPRNPPSRRPDLIPCPVCHGSGRNPEAPAEIVDDNGTCLVCCFSLHPLYAAHHGYVRPIA